jgi:hypothetical protein
MALPARAYLPTGPDYIEEPDWAVMRPADRTFRRLTENEVKGIVKVEIESALGTLGSKVSEERRQAIRDYYGRPFGNEQEGRSRVVLTDVADTIEWIMPSLMRMFTGGAYTVKFLPRSAEDVEAAEQATETINHIFNNECNGFSKMYSTFKTALLEKNGFWKVYYEERFEPKRETYRGLTMEGLMLLLADDHLEPIAFEQREDGLFDIVMRQAQTIGQIKIDTIPPEEFLIARRSITLDDETAFAAHRKKMTISDLIAMGLDPEVVKNLPSDDSLEYTQERVERLTADETWPVALAERVDGASREVWLTECIMRLDEDGDGYAELRKILTAGEGSLHLLSDEEINWSPLCSVTPIPMPHKFFGLSVADLTHDLQIIRSTVLRQMLDNLYLQNNGRWEVVEGAVNIDDLLVSQPGGIVRVDAPGMVNPLATTPFNAMAFQMMEFLSQVKEERTGASRMKQGLDASALRNTTATAASQMMSAAYAKIELIGRIFAETGVKDLFRKMLKLMVETPMKKRVIRLRGQWVEVDPSTWNSEMDVEVQVGLGVGQANERIEHLMQILEIQKNMADAGVVNVVTPEKAFNVGEELTRTMGFKVKEHFFQDPTSVPPPQPKPDPKIFESKRRQADNQADRDLEMLKAKRDAAIAAQQGAFRLEELKEKMKLERERIASQERIALRKCELDAELSRRAEKSAEPKETSDD